MCRCPTFVCTAPLPSTSLTYVCTCGRTSLEFTTVLHWYALLVCRQNCRPPFVRVAEPRWYSPLSYFRTRFSSAVNIAELRSYALQNLVCMCRCPTFVPAARLPSTSRPRLVRVAEPRWYSPLSYIRTHCSSAVNIAELHSYALQNLVGIHRCPTFVCAAPLPSTSLTYVRMRCTSAVYIVTYARTRCRTSLVFTAVLHSYALLVCRQHRRPPFVCVAEPRWYAPCQTFVCPPRLPPLDRKSVV